MRSLTVLSFIVLLCSGCASYQYAKNVKLISFDNDVSKGRSVGPTRGEDCTWSFLGYQLGDEPTLDLAFSNARQQLKGTATSKLGYKTKQELSEDKVLRYINHVTTDYEGFNAFIVGSKCLVVKGTGYR